MQAEGTEEGKFGFKTERQSVKFSHMSKGSLAKNVWEALWHSGWTLQGHSHQRRRTCHCEQSHIFSTKSPFPNKMSPQHPEHRSISTWEPDSERQVGEFTCPLSGWNSSDQQINLQMKRQFCEQMYPRQPQLSSPKPAVRFSVDLQCFAFPAASLLRAPGPCLSHAPALTSPCKPAPQAVFLPHLSSGQRPSFQLLGPKPQSSWILFFLSYPTFNQLVGSPGSFTFKTESDSKPLHSPPATTHLQTTSRLNYSFS